MLGGLLEILQEGWAEPAFHVELFGRIPVAAITFSQPIELEVVVGKRIGGKNESEAFSGILNA